MSPAKKGSALEDVETRALTDTEILSCVTKAQSAAQASRHAIQMGGDSASMGRARSRWGQERS